MSNKKDYLVICKVGVFVAYKTIDDLMQNLKNKRIEISENGQKRQLINTGLILDV